VNPKAKIEGPVSASKYTPNVARYVDHMLMHNAPHQNLPSAPSQLRKAMATTREAFVASHKVRSFMDKNGPATLPSVNKTHIELYVAPKPVVAVPAALNYTRDIMNKEPTVQPEPVVVTSLV